jgi:2,4-dienoyl-CoA reductase-like NADH-dependent reductase (Old Yellow Enzyme family)
LVQGPASAQPPVPPDFPYNWIVYAGTQIKQNVGVPVIVVNGVRTPRQAAYLVENDLGDFVALGKSILANPNWPRQALEALATDRRAKEGQEAVATCSDCKVCAYFRPGSKCPVQKKTGAASRD